MRHGDFAGSAGVGGRSLESLRQDLARKGVQPMSMAVVVGNPRPNSRTLRVAQGVADALSNAPRPLIGPVGDRSGRRGSRVVPARVTAGGRRSDSGRRVPVLVVASPTYKATYTGLLKSFFDRYAANALHATAAVGVMTGAGQVHALAVEVHLRPLLVELGAATPTRGLYVTEQQFDDLEGTIGPWADEAAPRIARHLD